MGRERPALFKGRHFALEIIILCVRRYLRCALSLCNLEEIMAERRVEVDHVTIWRWIQCYAPELSRRCRPELRKTNGSWRVDETHLRVAGKWTYLYRAGDSTGDTIDFLLSPTHDAGAAKPFFQRALQSLNHPRPRVVNVDRKPAHAYAAEHDRYYGVIPRLTRWFTELYLQQTPKPKLGGNVHSPASRRIPCECRTTSRAARICRRTTPSGSGSGATAKRKL